MRTGRAWLAAALLLTAAGAQAAKVLSTSFDVYEVYTEFTVALDAPAAFTCEAGGAAGVLALSVAASAPEGLALAPAGRITAARLSRAKGAATFLLDVAADAGPFRAYLQKEPPAVIVDVYRRLVLTPPKAEPRYARFLRGRKVLLVDDDDGPSNGNKYSVDVDGRYRAALKRMGVAFELYVVRAGRDGPSAAALAPYPFVIWFTGLDARPRVISAADEGAMTSYINGGGRLVLVSQNYLSDASRGRTAFCRETLGITSYKADTQVAAVEAGPAAAALPAPAYSLDNDLTIIGNWGDGFTPPPDAEVFFTGGDGLSYGALRGVGAGRVAFFSCALENVGSTGRLSDIISATLAGLAED